MPLQYYKPNKKNTGSAATFSFNSKVTEEYGPAIFVEIVKQNGWNQEARGGMGNGIFKGGEKTTIKLSTTEAATIIDAIERREDAPQFFHKGKESSSTIRFVRFKGKVKNEEGAWVDSKDYTNYGLAVSRSDESFKISFTLGEAKELSIWLENALHHCFNGLYSADLKKRKEYQEKLKDKEPSKEKDGSAPKNVQDFVNENTESEDIQDDDIPF